MVSLTCVIPCLRHLFVQSLYGLRGEKPSRPKMKTWDRVGFLDFPRVFMGLQPSSLFRAPSPSQRTCLHKLSVHVTPCNYAHPAGAQERRGLEHGLRYPQGLYKFTMKIALEGKGQVFSTGDFLTLAIFTNLGNFSKRH